MLCFCLHRRMGSMAVVSSTPSLWSWLQPENWHYKYMMKPGRYVRAHTDINSNDHKHLFMHFSFFFSLSVVFLPLQSASMCRVRRSRHWPTDQGSGERLPSAGGHARKTGRHDGEGQDRTGLLQVRLRQEEEVFPALVSASLWILTSTFVSSSLQLPGPGRGRSHAGHGLRAADKTHRGTRHHAT